MMSMCGLSDGAWLRRGAPPDVECFNFRIINPFYKRWDECSCEDAVGSFSRLLMNSWE
jgi:hypothetical protein